MTSNLGGQLKGDGLGFQPLGTQGEAEQVLREHFSPEFLGRLDQIIHFAPLDVAALEKIAQKYLHQLSGRAETVGLRLEMDEDLAAKLGGRCHQKEGARQLRRMIQQELEAPLAELLLRNPKKLGKVQVRITEDQLQLNY